VEKKHCGVTIDLDIRSRPVAILVAIVEAKLKQRVILLYGRHKGLKSGKQTNLVAYQVQTAECPVERKGLSNPDHSLIRQVTKRKIQRLKCTIEAKDIRQSSHSNNLIL
jgi:hypothetical protein